MSGFPFATHFINALRQNFTVISRLSVPRWKVSSLRDGPVQRTLRKNHSCVIRPIIAVFLYSPQSLIIHERLTQQRDGKKECFLCSLVTLRGADPLYWWQVIMQSTGITCLKWVNPALWSVAKDTVLNHAQEHEGFCVSWGWIVTRLPPMQRGGCCTGPRCETLPCFNHSCWHVTV